MSVTTIKVGSTARDRLAHVARARGITMGALLDEVSRRLEAEQSWAEIEQAYEAAQRADPDGWRDYLAELAELVVGDRDLTAAEEWPEYNT